MATGTTRYRIETLEGVTPESLEQITKEFELADATEVHAERDKATGTWTVAASFEET